jgi:hypothetical protein
VTVAFKGFDPKEFKVESASITEPHHSIGVRIYDPRDDSECRLASARGTDLCEGASPLADRGIVRG